MASDPVRSERLTESSDPVATGTHGRVSGDR